MVVYRAPLRDFLFVLDEIHGAGRLTGLAPFAEATPDALAAVLREGARFCEEVLAPLNASGDREGCAFEDGSVRMPAGFRDAYRRFVAGGWPSLIAAPQYGGQGLPRALGVLFTETVCSANVAFGTVPGLTEAAYELVAAWGGEAEKALYLPKLASGEWTGTMCLTEPQAGTDLGLIRTRAEPDGEGWRVTGTKIFTSCGEHDLADNIVHMVLARLSDAPAGSRGTSLFLVPKLIPDDNGEPGRANALGCVSIEEKMGLHASPTCVMAFDGAEARPLGEPNRGLRQMFTMMNAARIAVGLQGLGLAETAYQSAAAYARERLAGRAAGGARRPEEPADPIVVHADVRRMLLRMRAVNEGARALAVWAGMAADIARAHPEPEARAEAEDRLALLTPVIKAFFTDHGFEAANLALQVYGGHGYIREHGVEQLVRDARIAQIYEGTNGVQALDLVGRKMSEGGGRRLRTLFHPIARFLEESAAEPALSEFTAPLGRAFSRLRQVTAWLARHGAADPEEGAAAASEYLRMLALVALGYMWALAAKAALAKSGDGADAAFYRPKLATARFYMQRVLPEANGLAGAIVAGKRSLMELEEDRF